MNLRIYSTQTIKTFFLFLIFISNLFAQQKIRFNHLTVNSGLSQNAVTCILQDHQGFMWFGTQDGLNRFDGYNFKIFKNIPNDKTSLSNSFIFSIYEDSSNSLFIETQDGIYQKYNPLKENFTKINPDSIDFSSGKFNSVGAEYWESADVEWVGGLSKDSGLKKIDRKNNLTTEYKNDPSNSSSLSSDKVYSVYKDKSGNLWVGTFNGLDKLNKATGNFTHYRHNPQDPNSIPDNWVWSIFEDSEGKLWIGTSRGGLSLFNSKTNSFTNYSHDDADNTSINDNFIFSIYEDRGKNIWIGTNNGGVNYFHSLSNSFEHYKNIPSNKNSLSGNNVLSMYVDNTSKCWIGTKNDGLNIYDRSKNKFTHITKDPSNKNSIISNSIQLIFQDHNGIFWLGTFDSGLDRYDYSKGIFKHFRHDPKDSLSISDNRIYSIYEDNDNILWIGTYGGGLNKYNRAKCTFKHYRHNPNDSTSLSADGVWALLEDKEGDFFVGTFGGGLNVFNRSLEKFTSYQQNPSDSNSISDNNIICLFEDSMGQIWIGTTKGLNLFDKKNKTFTNYREKDGLSNDIIFGILEDDDQNLWISTNKGLSKFSLKNKTFRNYFYEDGLQSNEFNQNAYAKDFKTGELYFGGVNGFNVFDPKNIKNNTYVPPMAFTSFIRYNTDDEKGKPIHEKGISVKKHISLSYKDNIVTFEFSAFNFYNNLMNEYKYKLEGFNKNWIQLGNVNTITFTNLSPGNYVLKVIGSNNDGLWNDNGVSLSIKVIPPIYKNNYAYGFYVLLFLGFLYSIRRFEINRREQKSKLLQTELSMKAAEAEKRALKIENDRKTEELEKARQMQLSMLPKKLPNLPHLDIAVFMRTATEVGGDYYDFQVQEDGTVNIIFGDATGHGLQAGTMVTLMKGIFVSDSGRFSMIEFMDHSNKIIKQIKLGQILMCLNFIKIINNKMMLSSAAMPPLYIYNNETKVIEEISLNGMPLGAMKNFPYQIYEKELKAGDTLLLITDGLPEQMNPNKEMFDYLRVKNKFQEITDQGPNDIIKYLIDACDEWKNSEIQTDDISIAVIKIK